jgi:hypothetical protein
METQGRLETIEPEASQDKPKRRTRRSKAETATEAKKLETTPEVQQEEEVNWREYVPKDKAEMRMLPLENRADYERYNFFARKFRLPVKFMPADMFEKRKVRFIRMDGQNGNELQARWRSAKHLIDVDRKLRDGEVYELPTIFIDYLNSRGIPQYKQVKHGDGRVENVFSHYNYRFSCQAVDL